MSRKSLSPILFALLVLAGAASAHAILFCTDCADFCCSRSCVTDTEVSTCGVSGPAA